MKKQTLGPPAVGNVVMTKQYGGTLVRFCDDYCRDKTPEDVQKILDRISEKISPAYLAAMDAKTATGAA